MEQLF